MLVESIFWLHALDALRVRNIRKLNSVVTPYSIKLCHAACSLLFMDKKSILPVMKVMFDYTFTTNLSKIYPGTAVEIIELGF
jgi:hypothetical protein